MILTALIVVAGLWGGVWFISGAISAFALAAAMLFVTAAASVIYGAPYIPTVMRTVHEVIAIAEIKKDDRFLDLGSGDGRLVIAAARAGAIAEGWEVSPYLWVYSWWKIYRAGLVGRARVRLRCFWSKRCDSFDLV